MCSRLLDGVTLEIDTGAVADREIVIDVEAILATDMLGDARVSLVTGIEEEAIQETETENAASHGTDQGEEAIRETEWDAEATLEGIDRLEEETSHPLNIEEATVATEEEAMEGLDSNSREGPRSPLTETMTTVD